MTTLLITGGSGLLGGRLLDRGKGAYVRISLDLHPEPGPAGAEAHFQCDLRDRKATEDRVRHIRPDAVIHTAALTDVDGCEERPHEAEEINVMGTENLVRACFPLKIPLVHLSTDYVFDGKEGPYMEQDRPCPISVYGRTKLESEQIVLQNLKQGIIARTMILFGYEPGARLNFVTWLVQSLAGQKELRVVDDQYGTPTWADDLAGMILALLENGCTGIYHTAGPELNHRLEFALQIADVFGMDRSLIHPVTTDQLQQKAPRPLRSGLIIEKAVRDTGFQPVSLKKALQTMKNQMKETVRIQKNGGERS
jgi:dTDP-4-dehydrorhamnose reductase